MVLSELIQRMMMTATTLTMTTGLLVSVAEAQTPPLTTRQIHPRHHGPMHRPGVDDGHRQAQAKISRNHITAPLGQSPNSVQNQPGIVNSVIEEFARVGAAQAQAPQPAKEQARSNQAR